MLVETRGIPDGWKLAPMLVSAGLDTGQVEALEARVGASALGEVLAWLGEIVVMFSLVRLVDQSTKRISDLVQAVKAYPYMDQAPLQAFLRRSSPASSSRSSRPSRSVQEMAWVWISSFIPS